MTCPECGSRKLSVELGPRVSLVSTTTHAVATADEGDIILVVRDCWECGWCETRELHLATIEVEAGDETVQRRRRLVDEVTAELADIQRTESLRDVMDYVRDVRRRERADMENDA